MFLSFEKWHGCKNDFLVTWLPPHDREIILNSLKRQASRLCDRRIGVGGDGILVLHTNPEEPLTPKEMTIINSDGSVAKNCGNGLRCAAMSVRRKHKAEGDSKALPELVSLLVEGQVMDCRFNESDRTYVTVAMEGIEAGGQLDWNEEVIDRVKTLESEHGFQASSVACYAIGNPHVVIETDDCSEALMLKLGADLQRGMSIDGINVHVIKATGVNEDVDRLGRQALGAHIGELYEVWVWERGAGPTHACGSGACSVGLFALADGLIARKDWVAIDMPGGRLFVQQKDQDGPVLLAGPAAFIFEGQVEI